MTRKKTGATERDPRDGICDHLDCDNEITDGRRTFCSDQCGTLYFYENNWSGLRYIRYLMDKGKCQNCGDNLVFYEDGKYFAIHDFPHFETTDRHRVYNKIHQKYFRNSLKLRIHYSHVIDKKNDKWCFGNCQEDNKAEIDHIKAIALGGPQLDLDNLQVLCHDCHATKTGIDRRNIYRKRSGIKPISYIKKPTNSRFKTKQEKLEEYFSQ